MFRLLGSCTNPDPTKYYKIKSSYSPLILGPMNGSSADNTLLYQDPDTGNSWQLWNFLPIDVTNQTYKIINMNNLAMTAFDLLGSHTVLSVEGSNRTDQNFRLIKSQLGCFISNSYGYFLDIYLCETNSTGVNSYTHYSSYPTGTCQQFVLKDSSKYLFTV